MYLTYKLRRMTIKKRGILKYRIPLSLYSEAELFLSALVSLVELVHTTSGVNELNLAGVEWM